MLPKDHSQNRADSILEVFAVAGYQYSDGFGLSIDQHLCQGDNLVVVREHSNRFDPLAIALYTTAGIKLGYIPRYLNNYFAMLIDAGVHLQAHVYHVRATKPPWNRIIVGIR